MSKAENSVKSSLQMLPEFVLSVLEPGRGYVTLYQHVWEIMKSRAPIMTTNDCGHWPAEAQIDFVY